MHVFRVQYRSVYIVHINRIIGVSSPLEALACNISFQMLTGAVLGFIDVKRGKEMEGTYSVIP